MFLIIVEGDICLSQACLVILHFTYGWDVSNNLEVFMATIYLAFVSGIKLVHLNLCVIHLLSLLEFGAILNECYSFNMDLLYDCYVPAIVLVT